VPAPADRTADRAEKREDQADHQGDDADRPDDRDAYTETTVRAWL
jgi:hypothetical protein